MCECKSKFFIAPKMGQFDACKASLVKEKLAKELLITAIMTQR